MSLGIMEQLVHCTVRIETSLTAGGTSCGTGFFMNFLQTETESVPVIVTNKHVVAGSGIGRFSLTLARPDGLPDIGNHRQFSFANFESLWLKHPNQNVDLAVFLVGPLLNQAQQSGTPLFFIPLQTALIPKESERLDLSTMEDIIMIGYPSGIWDAKNNLPVIRRGITATHCAVNWNGNTEFLTDIASFPGSSGSPVLLANIGGYMDRRGNTYMGTTRIRLLGIHYAGAMHTASGEIKIVTAPTSNIPISLTQIPNNIGVAINSRRILELEPMIAKAIGK